MALAKNIQKSYELTKDADFTIGGLQVIEKVSTWSNQSEIYIIYCFSIKKNNGSRLMWSLKDKTNW